MQRFDRHRLLYIWRGNKDGEMKRTGRSGKIWTGRDDNREMGGWVNERYKVLIRFTDMGGCAGVRVEAEYYLGGSAAGQMWQSEIRR